MGAVQFQYSCMIDLVATGVVMDKVYKQKNMSMTFFFFWTRLR